MINRKICRTLLGLAFQAIRHRNSTMKSLKEKKIQNIPYFAQQYFCITMLGFISVTKNESSKNFNDKEIKKNFQTINTDIQSVISQSDELFLVGKFDDSLKILLEYKDSDNAEILWRIARDLYNKSKHKGNSKSEHILMINDAFNYINKAMELNDKHFAIHKWTAILIDAKSSLEGIKSRIKALPVFKKHLLTAIELNPKDATSIYMMGQFMYNIADMSKFQLAIAKALFGSPPQATFEEALQYFSKAEEVEPNFYSANLLMLGKTLLKLKRIESALYWLKCAWSYPVRTDEDEAVKLEAEELLKKYPVVKINEENISQ